MVTRTLQLDEDDDAALEAEAKAAGKSVEKTLIDYAKRLIEERRIVQAALADAAAGRTVDNHHVMDWVRSWGTDDEKDPPVCPE